MGYAGGNDPWVGYSEKKPGTALRANLLRGWIIETLLDSKSAKALANFAKQNEIKITITFNFSRGEDSQSLISYSVDDAKEHEQSNDLDFEVIYYSDGRYY